MLKEKLLDEVFSVIADGAISSFRKHYDDNKIKKQISDGINHIIEAEQSNLYYDALDKALSGSKIIQDYTVSLRDGSDRFNLEERLQNLGRHFYLTDMEKSYVISVLQRLCHVIENVLKKNLSDDTRYLAGKIESNSNQLTSKLDVMLEKIGSMSSLPLSIYTSHSIPDCEGTPLIKRYIIPMDLGDHLDHGINLPSLIDCFKQSNLILILGTAGSGKSYTIHQIVREAELKHLHVIFYRLNELNSSSDNALSALAAGRVSMLDYDSNNTVILLDGFDEILNDEARDWLVKSIRQITEMYPSIRVAISSRSNADYTLLKDIGFKTYRIKPLNQVEIENYLEKSGINKVEFLKHVEINELNALCLNTFYLSEMIGIWRQERSLPSNSRLMDAIITKRITNDSGKYAQASALVEQSIRDTRYRFERIALIMQCMHRDYLTTGELIRITGDKDKAVLECHGIWSKDDQDKWKFAHNNFREFFAALALSKKCLREIKVFISCGIDRPFIRASWHNTLSYLIARDGNDDLQDWIISIQPELILLFEKDRFSENKRAALFAQLMDKAREDHSWLDMDYSYLQKLALFASSPGAIRYIIDELKKEIPIRQKQNLLRCLRFFDTYYDYRNDVIKSVFDIASDTNNPDYYRSDALRVMESHPEMFLDKAEAVAGILRSSIDESVRYGALQFLEASGTIEEYFDAILNELDRCIKRHPRLINLKIAIDRVISNIVQESSAYELLSYLRDNLEHVYSNFEDDAFIRCCEVGASTYSGSDDRICKCLIEIAKTGYLLISYEKFCAIKQYMQKTHTVSLFLNAVWEQDIVCYRAGMICVLMSDEMARTLLDYMELGKISFQDLKEIIEQMPYNDPWQINLIELVRFRTGERIDIEPPVDYKGKTAREHQMFFDALFDESAFSDLGEKVCAIIGRDTPIKESFSCADADTLMQIHGNKAMSDWYYFIRSIVPDDSPLTFAEYRKAIDDWDKFCFCAVERTLENHKATITISDRQREWLSQYAKGILAKSDLKSEITVSDGRITYPKQLYICLSVMQHIDMECGQDLAVQLLSIPSPILKAESSNALPTYAVKWLDQQTITRTIVSNIHAGELNSYTAPAYVHYCMEHEVTECKEDIITYMIDGDKNCGFVFAEAEYITKLFGEDTLLEEVLPHCDDDRLLECIATHIRFGTKSSELDNSLWNSYRKTNDIKWLKYLINRNSVNALEEYANMCRDRMAIPDMKQNGTVPEVTDAIRTIYKMECLESLIDLLSIVSEPKFDNNEESSAWLINSCIEAITNIAKANFAQTLDSLEANKCRGNDVFSETIADIIHKIKSKRVFASDIALTFDAAFLATE